MKLVPIAQFVWEKKYALPTETKVEDTWRRVAKALAAVEKQPAAWEDAFYAALEDFRFLPAGRIIAGAGTGRAVTLSNCFVMGTIPDSLEGIFSALKEAALTMQQGGGIGYDFSTLRPKGALVKGVDADASGPLSFMDVWDAMCRTIMSAGARRGAMMATMRCDHPDIGDFIEAKRDPVRLRMFNLSVLITDAFMAAVKADTDWPLTFKGKVYRTVQAKDLWDKITRNTFDFAEPGVIFIDRVNADHNLSYMEEIAATNPCGEKPMAPYGSCLLGSINLTKFVLDPFTPQAQVNVKGLELIVKTAIRMMDNVIDAGQYPLPQQAAKAQDDRQLGLGVTGLADMLCMLGLVYGSPEAIKVTQTVMEIILDRSYRASIALAREKGAFPAFEAEGFLRAPHAASRLYAGLQYEIHRYGIRNSLLVSIAPTGTISLLAGNVSSGIEPIFAPSYTRKVLQKDGSRTEELVEDYAVALWRQLRGDTPLPDYFVSAQTLTPMDHVRMQAAVQVYVDSSISKTINCPEDISFEDFQNVYMAAWDQGCKGCTTYRPNAVTGSILSVETTDKPAPAEAVGPLLTQRPQAVGGSTYKLKWPGSDHALYITINDVDGRPFEIFVNSNNVEHFAWTVGLTRMISAVFRRGGDVSFIADELKAVFDPRGGAWLEGKYVPSILAAIGGVIESHMGLGVAQQPPTPLPSGLAAPTLCGACGSSNVKNEGGCQSCADCGQSKCG